jgi:hypothetical protein
MTEVLVRLALFTLLPALLGAAIVLFDRSATGAVRRAEAFVVPLFLVGAGGGGVSGFIAHVLISEPAARAIGWEPGSAVQLVAGFASLATGLLGAVAAERRDRVRELAVVAVAVLGAGMAVAYLMNIGSGGMGLGLLQAAGSIVLPALLASVLLALRRNETELPTIVLKSWMIPVRNGSVVAVGIAATSFGLGYSTGQVVLVPLAGAIAAVAAFWVVVSRAPSHRVKAAA